MEELEVTWMRAFKVWWSLTWRIIVYSMIFGIVIGMPLGLAAAALGIGQGQASVILQNLATVIGLILGIWILKVVLTKSYSDFRIVLVPSDEALLERTQQETPEQPDNSAGG